MDTHQTGERLTNDSLINGIETLHFIVTRPEGQQQELIAQLKALNNRQEKTRKQPAIKIMHLPLISIEPHHAETQRISFECFKGIIFISKNAVKYSKLQLSEKQWKSLLEKPLYAIGEATANLLNSELGRLGILKEVIFPNRATSESLLALNNLQAIEQQDWLVVKGVAGRDKLRAGLTNRKAKVSELEVYKRNKPPNSVQKKIVEQRQGDSKITLVKSNSSTKTIWLVSSAEGLKNLSNILNREPQDLDSTQGCLVITTSDRITKVAENLGFTIAAQSNNATDEALFSCVRNFVCKKLETKSKLNSDR